MKRLLAAAILAFSVLPAHAIERYNINRWSCAKAQDVVQSQGAVVYRYTSTSGSGMTLYDRFVASSYFCPGGKYAEVKSVPTADTRHCPLYYCKDIDHDDRIRIFP